MAQIVIGIAVLLIIIFGCYLFYRKRKKQTADTQVYTKPTMDMVLKRIKDELANITKETDMILTSDINYETIVRNKKRVDKNDRESVYGIPSAVEFMTGFCRTIIEEMFPTKEKILEVWDFENTQFMEPQLRWEILIYKLNKICGSNTIRYLEDNYKISELQEKKNYEYVNGEKVSTGTFKIREFDTIKLKYIFDREVVDKAYEDGSIMSYAECLDVFARIAFSMLRGNEEIDTLTHQTKDGFHFGASGSIRYKIEGKFDAPYKTTNSVWVQIDAKWVLFSFIDFKTVEKMKKIINQRVSYGSSATMTEKKPYKVCDGPDGSRRVAIRPGAGETWFYTERSFTLSVYKMRALLDKPYVSNWELPATLIMYLMKAEETTAFTGQQNTGKTSIMKGAVEFVEDKNIRVLEMAFELALRELYPWKDVFTVKPTEYVSSAQLQDLLKKTDSWMSMVGEVAEDIVAARMIQFCLIASAFTVFSHHGLDDIGLINGLTNSLVASGEYKDHRVAKSTVLDAIKNNVHLAFTDNKERVIEYISQIIKEDEVTSYPEIEELLVKARAALNEQNPNVLAECMIAYTMLTREYYTRTTDRVTFTSRKIIVFNKQTGAYEPNEWYTPEAFERICKKLNDEDRAGFIKFYKENWKKRGAA